MDARLNYMNQNSRQTLQEALDEYYSVNSNLLDPNDLEEKVRVMFRRHDAGHVVFGCDTSLRGETLIDTWTMLGTTAGLRGYLEYFKYPQVNQIFSDVGYLKIVMESLRCIPALFRILVRSRRLHKPWCWEQYAPYMNTSLDDIRTEFNIRVV